ncbi:acyl-CoA N-acyltransferase, partial [Cystobasidium minutum MCA 4210]|uniref:acyl-CoA N-acyltransferase n=1 Tax=Cystobasidium minutum MCA 4210 TaxID=1397322 RepID=UPI0034CFD84E|eukprot:jgi/Rhomi1/147313/e_gw1.8.12.1
MSGPVKARKDKTAQTPVKLYVCEGCFKYMVHPASYAIHFRSCKMRHPPGRKVYQKGAQTIWEIDGEAQKLYCQNLCLFGKLFIDHKYVFFETSGFLFYVLTEGRPSFDHAFGFFSKEKISYNDYNLACIVTFPPYQRKGYGTVMIEFSYELSSRALYSRRAGTPERPLSDLGLRGYLQYWTSVLIRYFR